MQIASQHVSSLSGQRANIELELEGEYFADVEIDRVALIDADALRPQPDEEVVHSLELEVEAYDNFDNVKDVTVSVDVTVQYDLDFDNALPDDNLYDVLDYEITDAVVQLVE